MPVADQKSELETQHEIEIPEIARQPLAKPSTLFGTKGKASIILALVIGALAYFSFTAFESAKVDFMTVADIIADAPTPEGKQVGLAGKLVKDSYVRSADGITANFRLKDEDGTEALQVRYQGEIGQVFFNDHSEIIVQGAKTADNVFVVSDLTVRCPSKFLTEQEAAEIEAQNGGQPLAPPYQPDFFDQQT